ncbi:hypothetical protein Tco_1376878 [Tanacetum coccineum]
MASTRPGNVIARRVTDDLIAFSGETAVSKYMKFFLGQKVAETRRFVNRMREEAKAIRSCIAQTTAVIVELQAMEDQNEVHDSLLAVKDAKHGEESKLLALHKVITEALEEIESQGFNVAMLDGLQHIHLGIFMIRLHALHRRSAGTNALVVLRDTRWEDSRQIIATMEVDLFAGTQLVYTFPDMILSVNDFHNHVEVAIQTHGYDTWQGGESNFV